MRLATIKVGKQEVAAIVSQGKVFLIKKINEVFDKKWETDIFSMLKTGQLPELLNWYNNQLEDIDKIEGIPVDQVTFGPLYRQPNKIWGIGLNYVEHAADLNEQSPNTEPASFMKPCTSIIGPNDIIKIPRQSDRTTAEAELGIVIGEKCRDVSEENAFDYVAGYTTVIDMTAEDILQKNPRYLTRAKSFDTFFSFGPELVTTDEIESIENIEVSTVINEETHRKNVISNMTFNPRYLISFHSKVMTLLPGDIISTGTPGAVVIRNGDTIACNIDGFTPLVNKVKDLKLKN